jgi:hypothetical protein
MLTLLKIKRPSNQITHFWKSLWWYHHVRLLWICLVYQMWMCRSGYRAWLEIMWALLAQVRILLSTVFPFLKKELFFFVASQGCGSICMFLQLHILRLVHWTDFGWSKHRQINIQCWIWLIESPFEYWEPMFIFELLVALEHRLL